MTKRLGLPAMTAGVLVMWLAGADLAHAGFFRGPYDFSLGLYPGGQGWSYNESYGYNLPRTTGIPSIIYYPVDWPLFTRYPYPYLTFTNPAYLGYHPSPAYMKAMARDVVLPPLDNLDGAAIIEIKMPCFGELWVDNVPTQQLGTDRLFTSPPLQKGCDYVYLVRARWNDNGRMVEQVQQVTVRAGDRIRVCFPKP